MVKEMTKEEALLKVKGYLTDCLPSDNYEEVEEIIRALEQQPCEDAISRDAVIKAVDSHTNEDGTLDDDISIILEDLPFVTPIRPKGEWEMGYTYPDGEYWKCSVCKELIRVRIPMHFCSNCGSDMRDMRGENNE